MIFTLDDERALDVAQAGAKASWLARGREAGLPVLPGVVLGAAASVPYLELGTSVLERSSSGAARLAIVGADQPDEIPDLDAATADMSEPMVVRSSSILEGSGAWSGAFTSYLDLQHGELGIGVLGCIASVFSASTLERYEATQIEPDSAPMAVLVQPALDTEFGGTARIRGEIVEIVAVRGSPGPLVQGWEPGVAGTVDGDDIITGTALTEMLGEARTLEISNTMHRAQISTGATACEWGWADGALTLFQLAKPPAPAPREDAVVPEGLKTDLALRIAHVARRYPGPLGEQLVLPWALSGSLTPVALEPRAPTTDIVEALRSAQAIAATLTSQAWGQPKSAAMPLAVRTLRELRGTEPDAALQAVAALGSPDRDQAGSLFSVISEIAAWLVTAGVITSPDLVWHLELETIKAAAKSKVPRLDRIGFDRWEPFTTAVVSANGVSASGSSAAPGVASGRFCRVLDSEDLRNFRPRDVLVSTHPVPNLAPVLWDAAAVVTTGGSAAAHLFESARALAIPAVCGVRLEEIIGTDLTAREVGEYVIAVDGDNGTITGMEW